VVFRGWLSRTGIATVLGIVATSWSLFVGQPVREAFRDPDEPLIEFRDKVGEACKQHRAVFEDAPTPPKHPYSTEDQALYTHMGKLQAGLAALQAPRQYADSFASLKKHVQSLTTAVSNTRGYLHTEGRFSDELRLPHRPNNKLLVTLRQRLVNVGNDAAIMQVNGCASIVRPEVEYLIELGNSGDP
jgi:hypothetical protein